MTDPTRYVVTKVIRNGVEYILGEQEKVSDEVAYQISQGNYDFLWRLTEKLYRQLNFLDTTLELESGENIIQVSDTYIGKILANDYFYTNYVAPSTYALTYINRNNTNYMFQLEEGLYVQINYIDPNLGVESGEDMKEVADTWYGKLISNNNFYNNYIAKSTYALNYINRNNTNYLFGLEDLFYQNLNYIDSEAGFTDGDTFEEMIDLPTEMAKLWNSSTLRHTYFEKSANAKSAWDSIPESKMVKILLAIIGEDVSSVSTYSALYSNSTFLNKIFANLGCVDAISWSTSASTGLSSTSSAMTSLIGNSTAFTEFCKYSIPSTKFIANNLATIAGSQSAMRIVMSQTASDTALRSNSTALNTISNNTSYIRNTFRNQDIITQSTYSTFQPYSYKIWTTLYNDESVTKSKYYTSDRDRTDGRAAGATKVSATNTFYNFGDTAIIFPTAYWDDNDSRSQQMRSQRFSLNVGYPHSSYGNLTYVDIISLSSNSRPMGFALKGCSEVNVGGSNNGLGMITVVL